MSTLPEAAGRDVLVEDGAVSGTGIGRGGGGALYPPVEGDGELLEGAGTATLGTLTLGTGTAA